MKKLITLALLLIFLSACTNPANEEPSTSETTKEYILVITHDDKTKRIEDYFALRFPQALKISASRQVVNENKIFLNISFDCIALYKLGQIIEDCINTAKAVLEIEEEQLAGISINSLYEDNNKIYWSSKDCKTGHLQDSIHSAINDTTQSLKKLKTFYSIENKELIEMEPRLIVDYYEIANIDTSAFPPDYFKVASYINKQIPKARTVLAMTPEEDAPGEFYIYVLVYRETSHDLSEIVKQAINAVKHAQTLTSYNIDQIAVAYCFNDTPDRNINIFWATKDFINGHIWDTRNTDLIPSDGREMSYEEVISFYTPQNKDLK